MAREVIERLVDDLDGSDADECVRFGLDARTYSIDLTEKNADEFRALLAPYVSAASLDRNLGQRLADAAPRRTRSGVRRAAQSERRQQVEAVRAWGRDQGFEISDRGRVSRQVWQAYEAAGSPGAF